jgi:hypothetical protein
VRHTRASLFLKHWPIDPIVTVKVWARTLRMARGRRWARLWVGMITANKLRALPILEALYHYTV